MARIHNDDYTVTRNLQVDGTTTLTGNVAAAGVVTGASYRDITMFYNSGIIVSDWTNSTNGIYLLATNKTADSVNFPLTALKEGDIIQKFRVIGGLEAISGSATTLDASLWSVTKAAAADCAATSLGAITQVSVTADTAVDAEKDITDVTIEDDLQYFIDVKVTTANTDQCAAMVAGVEADIKRLI